MTKDKLIDQASNRLQFAITILVFFLVVFPEIGKAGAILVVAYIVDYIFFEIIKGKIEPKGLRLINHLLLAGVGSFIIPLIIIAMSTREGIVPMWQGYIILGSAFGSVIALTFIPVVILVSLIVLAFLNRNKRV